MAGDPNGRDRLDIRRLEHLAGRWHPDGPDWLPDRCTPLIAHLSRRFDEVQYFGTYRIVGYHAW